MAILHSLNKLHGTSSPHGIENIIWIHYVIVENLKIFHFFKNFKAKLASELLENNEEILVQHASGLFEYLEEYWL